MKNAQFTPFTLLAALLLATALPLSDATAEGADRFDAVRDAAYDSRLLIQEKVDRTVRELREEVANPTPESRGFGGGIIDTHYIRQVIAETLGDTGAFDALQSAYEKESDPVVRDWILAAAGLASPSKMKDKMQELLLRHPVPGIRTIAAEALGKLRDKSLVQLFILSMRDPYYRIASVDCVSAGPPEHYIVAAKATVSFWGAGFAPEDMDMGEGRTIKDLKSVLERAGFTIVGSPDARPGKRLKLFRANMLNEQRHQLLSLSDLPVKLGRSLNRKEKRMTVSSSGKRLSLEAGRKTATLDGKEIELDAAPRLDGDRMFVPLSMFWKWLDIKIISDGKDTLAYIY